MSDNRKIWPTNISRRSVLQGLASAAVATPMISLGTTYPASAEAIGSAGSLRTRNSWMAGIADDTLLSKITIPGTHDTMAYPNPRHTPSPKSKTQNLKLEDQLNAGIRFVDMRCVRKGDIFKMYHGVEDLDITFSEALDICDKFLSLNPSECIVMLVTASAGDEATFDRYVSSSRKTRPNAEEPKLRGGQQLSRGQYVNSQNSKFSLVLQPVIGPAGANLVLYENIPNNPNRRRLWAKTPPKQGLVEWVEMRPDGNFALVDGQKHVLWESKTSGHPGAFLTVQDDGNVVIYDGDKQVWATNTWPSDQSIVGLWYLGDTIPKLGDVRGKIVLLRNFPLDDRSTHNGAKGIDVIKLNKDDAYIPFTTGSATFRVQNYYILDSSACVSKGSRTIETKWGAIKRLLDDAKNNGPGPIPVDTWFINYTSASWGPFPDAVANRINPKLLKYLSECGTASRGGPIVNPTFRLGTVVMDFPDSLWSVECPPGLQPKSPNELIDNIIRVNSDPNLELN